MKKMAFGSLRIREPILIHVQTQVIGLDALQWVGLCIFFLLFTLQVSLEVSHVCSMEAEGRNTRQR